MTWVAGTDGCKVGWVVVLQCVKAGERRYYIVHSASDILSLPEKPTVIAIDMPIGLLESAERGGRECDRQARRLLGPPRACSVFSPPVRKALSATDYPGALSINRSSSSRRIGITRQCFSIFSKLSEIDNLMTPSLQNRVKEVHPEVSFLAMNKGKPLECSKHLREGIEQRRRLLKRVGFGDLIELVLRDIRKSRKSQAKKDDILDACVACWTARRIHQNQAVRIPDKPHYDSKGLLMEIWR